MADNDNQGPFDGYGLGGTREGLGFGYLSGQVRGAATFQVSAALALTEVLTIAGSHKTMHRVPALAWSEVITIAASHVTHGTPAFQATIAGPFGSTTHGTGFDVAVSYTASPTAQTNAIVRLSVTGAYDNGDGTFPNINTVFWVGSDPVGWTVTTDWTAGSGGFSWYSEITKTPIGTGTAIGSFTVAIMGGTPDGLVGSVITVYNRDVFGVSHTDTATSTTTSFVVTVT